MSELNENVELAKLYSAIKWTKRLPAKAIIPHHIEFITKNSQDMKNLMKYELNIPYGKGEREKYDIYGTDLPDDSPVLINLHGGFWSAKEVNHSINCYIARCLYKNGIKTIIIGYELCPDVTLEYITHHVCIAISQCLEYVKNMKSRGLYLFGHSAGAQLAAKIFENFVPSLPKDDQRLFKSAYLVSGVYDVVPLVYTKFNLRLKLDEQSAKMVSPIYSKLSAEGTSFYIIVGGNESPAFKEQSKRFNEHLLSLGLKSKFISISDTDHYDIVQKLLNEDYELTKIIINDMTKN